MCTFANDYCHTSLIIYHLRKHTIIVSYPNTNPFRLQRYNNLLNYKNCITRIAEPYLQNRKNK